MPAGQAAASTLFAAPRPALPRTTSPASPLFSSLTSIGMRAAPVGTSLLASTRMGGETAVASRRSPLMSYTPASRRKAAAPTWVQASSIAR